MDALIATVTASAATKTNATRFTAAATITTIFTTTTVSSVRARDLQEMIQTEKSQSEVH
jgi:hypothetical protein